MTQCLLLKEWISDESKEALKECRWCSLAVLIGEYQKTLSDNGNSKLGNHINNAIAEEGDIFLKIAEAMDGIKEQVNPELRTELENLDCEAQLAARQDK